VIFFGPFVGFFVRFTMCLPLIAAQCGSDQLDAAHQVIKPARLQAQCISLKFGAVDGVVARGRRLLYAVGRVGAAHAS
jgi:hypothetical protein